MLKEKLRSQVIIYLAKLVHLRKMNSHPFLMLSFRNRGRPQARFETKEKINRFFKDSEIITGRNVIKR